jgi:hypothetical protein
VLRVEPATHRRPAAKALAVGEHTHEFAALVHDAQAAGFGVIIRRIFT